jgi:hypothetical protein
LKTIKAKMEAFDSKVNEAVKDVEETSNVLMRSKSEIEQLREKQMRIIDSKFKELV